MMRDIGIYLGVNSFAVVFVQEKKVTSFSKYPIDLDRISYGLGPSLEVFINKVSRELKMGKEDNIYLSLWDKDFIFRSFLIPPMKRKEIENSIGFEIEKYIPFKIEDLTWNYSYQRLSREKKLLVSFLGFKKNIFTHLTQTFTKLDLNLLMIEPASLSLSRVLRSIPFYSKLNWFALLDYTPQESYLTFFYRELPIFNRTLLSLKGRALNKEKIIEEVKFALQYFNREHRGQSLEKMLVVVDKEKQSELASFKEDTGIDVDFVIPQEILGNQNIDLPDFKAYAAGSYNYSPRRFMPYLLESARVGFLGSRRMPVYPLNVPLLGGVIILGLVATISLNLFFNKRIELRKRELLKKQEEVTSYGNLKNQPLQILEGLVKEKKNKIKFIEERINSKVNITSVLKRLSSLFPPGLWLEKIEVNMQETPVMKLSGYVYLGDFRRELDSVGEFVSNLKEEQELKKIFSAVKPVRREKSYIGEYSVTYFEIKLSR